MPQQEYDIGSLLQTTPAADQGQDINELLASIKAPSSKEPMSWKDVPITALRNLPESTMKLGHDVFNAVAHPITTGMGMLDVAAGALGHAVPSIAEMSARIDPQNTQRAMTAAEQLGQMYKQRYGSEEGFKAALAQDPASVLADVATVAAPATKALGMRPLAAAGDVAAQGLGMTTGVGGEAVKTAFKSGLEGDKAFMQNLRGQVPMQDVLETAKQNLQNMKTQKNDAYRSGMVDIKNDKSVLGFNDVDQALSDAQKMSTYKGQIKNEEAYKAYQKIQDEVNAWKKLNPSEYHTPEGFDALKQKIGGIVDSIPYEEKTAKQVGNQVYNKLRSTINDQAPTYSKVMGEYSDASDTIREIERTLSLNPKASVDTQMRKLQSLTRNNVQTNYGNRLDLARQLEAEGGQSIMPALAGQAMSSVTPRGLAGQVGGLGTLGASYLANPAALAALPLQSPALVGAGAYGLGRGISQAAQLRNKIPVSGSQGTALIDLLSQINKKADQQ